MFPRCLLTISAVAVALELTAQETTAATVNVEVCNRLSDPVQLTQCHMTQTYKPLAVYNEWVETTGASTDTYVWIAVAALDSNRKVLDTSYVRGGFAKDRPDEIAFGSFANLTKWDPVTYQCWVDAAGLPDHSSWQAPWFKSGDPSMHPPVGSSDYVCTPVGETTLDW